MKSKNHRILSRKESKDNHEEGVLHRFLNVKGFNTATCLYFIFSDMKTHSWNEKKKEKKKGEE